jgi:nucleotide-binding universal stress UspA family protein
MQKILRLQLKIMFLPSISLDCQRVFVYFKSNLLPLMKTLLLCTDGSNYADTAAKYTAWLAKRLHAEVEALYASDLKQFDVSIVTDLSGAIGIEPYQAVLSQLQQMEAHKAAAIQEGAELYFKKEGLGNHFHFHHATGQLVDRLEDFEKRTTPPDLVVLGKRGENADFAAEHLGSTMERVVRASKSPCLVTPRLFKPIERIAIAYDGGTSCQKAIQFLKNHEDTFHDMKVHLISVHENHDSEKCAQLLQEAEAQFKNTRFHVVSQSLHGLTENTISDYIDEHDIHLLMMGAYGHSRIRYLILGSTTTDLIRRCKTPIILFR